MFMMTLDRRAFDEVRYWMVCHRIQAGDVSFRKEFGREVCGEGTQGKTSEKITAKDWQNHPAIVEIRALYQALIDAKERGVLRQQQRVFSYCHPNGDVRRVLYTDQEGRPRIYLYEGGSDDSRMNHELYYANRGQLRFAFITAGAVNATQIEHRVYFAEDGRKIWEIQKQLEGPGYTFPTEWPDDDLILQPVATFRAESRCPEEK
jgi:hypothetical protein